MSRPVLPLLLSLIVFLGTVSSACGEDSGPYASLFGGLVLLDEAENDDNTGTYNLSYDSGMAVGGAVGYRLGNRFPQLGKGRIEAEIAYRENDLDAVEFSTGEFSADGQITGLSVMVNAIAEYKNHPKFTPYVGLGLGAARISMKDTRVNGGEMIDDDDIVLAYQVMVGTDYILSEHWSLDVGYRFMGTDSPEFEDNRQREVSSEYFSHTFGLGLRVSF